MTRRRKALVVIASLALLAAAAGIYWQMTATGRQVDRLLAEVYNEEPGRIGQWLIDLGLREPPSRLQSWDLEGVAGDLAALGPPAVPHLIAALKRDPPTVRACAALALGKIGDARAIDPLLKALREDGPLVPFFAGMALVELRQPLTEPLTAMLQDPDWHARVLAAEMLGMLGDERATGPLEQAANDPDERVRTAATEALQRHRE